VEDKQPAAGDVTAEAATETADAASRPDERATAATEAATESAEVSSGEGEGADGDAATEQAETEDGAADEGDAKASATATEGGRVRKNLLAGKRLAIAVAVAAMLFVGSAAFAGAAVQPYLTDRATAATKLKVARTAANAIRALWTYTPENMDKLADRASVYLSGDFEAQYRKFVDAIVAPNKQAKVTNTTDVTGAAVESLDDPNAVVIVYTNTTSTSPLSKNIPSLKYLSYRLFMKRTNGRWLVTRMTTITSLDLTPHL
jgi:Mce-associated membrane protein